MFAAPFEQPASTKGRLAANRGCIALSNRVSYDHLIGFFTVITNA